MSERNLSIDLNNPQEVVSQDVLQSNSEYGQGYVPYAIRRRMDLYEGEKHEIVNDVAVNLECARLRNYGNRRYASRAHIHDLLAYTFSKGTLITPERIEDPDKVIREGDIYNQARMGWECAKYYIHNTIIEKILWGTEFETKHRIDLLIHWNDFIDFILAALKLKHDPEIAELFAFVLYRLKHRYYESFLSEDYTERMLTYVFVGSRYGELSRLDENLGVLDCLHAWYGDSIGSLAAGFEPHEAGLIDTTRLDTEVIRKYAYALITHGHQILKKHDGKFRFSDPDDEAGFLMQVSKEVKNFIPTGDPAKDKENRRQFFAGKIAMQDGIEERHIHLLTEKPVTLEEAEKMVRSKRENRFVTFGLWMQYQAEEEMYPYVKPKWVSEKNRWFTWSLCAAMSKKFFAPWNFSTDTASIEWTYRVFKQLTKLLVQISSKFPEGTSTAKMMEGNAIFQPFMSLSTAMWDSGISIPVLLTQTFNEAVYTFLHQNKLRDFGVKMLLEAKYQNLTDEDLEYLLEHNVSISDVLKIASIDKNLKFLQKHHGTEFIELPQESVMNWKKDICIPEESMKWLHSVLTDEQMKSYPFNKETMQAYPKIFEPYVDQRNVDRYAYAYGLNWVEEHYPVSISDIVNSGSYVGAKTIERYLDIILLDDELRLKALSNGYVLRTFKRYPELLKNVLSANNFSNQIKCEVLTKVLIDTLESDPELPNQKRISYAWARELIRDRVLDILPGGKMEARALIGVLNMAGYYDYAKYLTDPVLDMTEQ